MPLTLNKVGESNLDQLQSNLQQSQGSLETQQALEQTRAHLENCASLDSHVENSPTTKAQATATAPVRNLSKQAFTPPYSSKSNSTALFADPKIKTIVEAKIAELARDEVENERKNEVKNKKGLKKAWGFVKNTFKNAFSAKDVKNKEQALLYSSNGQLTQLGAKLVRDTAMELNHQAQIGNDIEMATKVLTTPATSNDTQASNQQKGLSEIQKETLVSKMNVKDPSVLEALRGNGEIDGNVMAEKEPALVALLSEITTKDLQDAFFDKVLSHVTTYKRTPVQLLARFYTEVKGVNPLKKAFVMAQTKTKVLGMYATQTEIMAQYESEKQFNDKLKNNLFVRAINGITRTSVQDTLAFRGLLHRYGIRATASAGAFGLAAGVMATRQAVGAGAASGALGGAAFGAMGAYDKTRKVKFLLKAATKGTLLQKISLQSTEQEILKALEGRSAFEQAQSIAQILHIFNTAKKRGIVDTANQRRKLAKIEQALFNIGTQVQASMKDATALENILQNEQDVIAEGDTALLNKAVSKYDTKKDTTIALGAGMGMAFGGMAGASLGFAYEQLGNILSASEQGLESAGSFVGGMYDDIATYDFDLSTGNASGSYVGAYGADYDALVDGVEFDTTSTFGGLSDVSEASGSFTGASYIEESTTPAFMSEVDGQIDYSGSELHILQSDVPVYIAEINNEHVIPVNYESEAGVNVDIDALNNKARSEVTVNIGGQDIPVQFTNDVQSPVKQVFVSEETLNSQFNGNPTTNTTPLSPEIVTRTSYATPEYALEEGGFHGGLGINQEPTSHAHNGTPLEMDHSEQALIAEKEASIEGNVETDMNSYETHVTKTADDIALELEYTENKAIFEAQLAEITTEFEGAKTTLAETNLELENVQKTITETTGLSKEKTAELAKIESTSSDELTKAASLESILKDQVESPTYKKLLTDLEWDNNFGLNLDDTNVAGRYAQYQLEKEVQTGLINEVRDLYNKDGSLHAMSKKAEIEAYGRKIAENTIEVTHADKEAVDTSLLYPATDENRAFYNELRDDVIKYTINEADALAEVAGLTNKQTTLQAEINELQVKLIDAELSKEPLDAIKTELDARVAALEAQKTEISNKLSTLTKEYKEELARRRAALCPPVVTPCPTPKAVPMPIPGCDDPIIVPPCDKPFTYVCPPIVEDPCVPCPPVVNPCPPVVVPCPPVLDVCDPCIPRPICGPGSPLDAGMIQTLRQMDPKYDQFPYLLERMLKEDPTLNGADVAEVIRAYIYTGTPDAHEIANVKIGDGTYTLGQIVKDPQLFRTFSQDLCQNAINRDNPLGLIKIDPDEMLHYYPNGRPPAWYDNLAIPGWLKTAGKVAGGVLGAYILYRILKKIRPIHRARTWWNNRRGAAAPAAPAAPAAAPVVTPISGSGTLPPSPTPPATPIAGAGALPGGVGGTPPVAPIAGAGALPGGTPPVTPPPATPISGSGTI